MVSACTHRMRSAFRKLRAADKLIRACMYYTKAVTWPGNGKNPTNSPSEWHCLCAVVKSDSVAEGGRICA